MKKGSVLEMGLLRAVGYIIVFLVALSLFAFYWVMVHGVSSDSPTLTTAGAEHEPFAQINPEERLVQFASTAEGDYET
ncbi:MAG: hypothetical protein HY832_00040 [Candidatus Aenigmarchaeota archaeon]|nr:hypothetical protein [Candidatus Aenigmarchaeota archaeon]